MVYIVTCQKLTIAEVNPLVRLRPLCIRVGPGTSLSTCILPSFWAHIRWESTGYDVVVCAVDVFSFIRRIGLS